MYICRCADLQVTISPTHSFVKERTVRQAFIQYVYLCPLLSSLICRKLLWCFVMVIWSYKYSYPTQNKGLMRNVSVFVYFKSVIYSKKELVINKRHKAGKIMCNKRNQTPRIFWSAYIQFCLSNIQNCLNLWSFVSLLSWLLAVAWSSCLWKLSVGYN